MNNRSKKSPRSILQLVKGKLLEVRSVNQVFVFVNNQHVGTLAEDLWSGRDYLAMLSRSLNAVGIDLEIAKMHAVDFYSLITPAVSASVAPYLARRDGATKKVSISRTEVALNMKANDIESILLTHPEIFEKYQVELSLES